MTGTQQFTESLMQAGNLNAAQAAKVIAVYRKARVMTTDKFSGVVSVKHGAFMDKETILRALAKAM